MDVKNSMSEYPIEGLMNTAMNSIKDMIDVNTIIGEPIETTNNIIVIPVSKVNFGFVAGGTEFKGNTKKNSAPLLANKENNDNEDESRMPFGGGSGAGVSISPIAFIIIQQSGVKLLPVDHTSALDKLLDFVPDLLDKTQKIIGKKLDEMMYTKSENHGDDKENADKYANEKNGKENKSLKNIDNNVKEVESTKNTTQKEKIVPKQNDANMNEQKNNNDFNSINNFSKNDEEIANDFDYEYDETDM